VHVRKGLLRNALFAVALVTLALPATQLTSSVTPTHAQTAFTQSSYNTIGGTCTSATAANCYVSATPGLAFNVLGTTHTVTFTCGAAVGPAPTPTAAVAINQRPKAATDLSGGAANAGNGVVPGCYNLSASVSDESGGAGATINAARCGDNAATLSGSTVNCAAYASPLCPVGATTSPVAGAFCSVVDANAPRGSTMSIQINPGAPHSFLITFTGYTPLLASCLTTGLSSTPPVTPPTNTNGTRGTCFTNSAGTATGPACPVGFTFVPGPFNLTTNLFAPPFEGLLTAFDGACSFTVTAEKKYVEITSLTLIPSGCSTTASPATLLFSEGLKAFFGPACEVVPIATGVVILKTGVNCASEPNGTTAPGFPPGSTYSCTGDTLSVIIPNIGASTLNSGPIPVTVTGTGSAGVSVGIPTPTLSTGSGDFCTGVAGPPVSTGTGAELTVCPTGPGTGTVQACTNGPNPDTQPRVCSAVITVSFILPNAARVVPYVRWAGEKQVLTKCFGGLGFEGSGTASPFAGALVEFTLEGAGGNPAQATLIPASAGGIPGSTGGSEPVTAPSQNTVITAADVNGCATVIVYAAGEGAVNVDAAIFSNSPTEAGTVPLVNEHAFEIFYLKYDHIDLENIKLVSVAGSTIIPASAVTALGFSTAGATFTLPSAPGSNPPGANGYTVPLCGNEYLRALVHGYFELPGDPSGRPATTVSIPGAPSGAVGSYVLPAGRWVLPEDWPVLATFAGFNASGAPFDSTPSSVFAWDLNSGWVFNPGGENGSFCFGPATPPAIAATTSASGTAAGGVNASGGINNTYGGPGVSYGPCHSADAAGTAYHSATNNVDNCVGGATVGIGPFDITQACTTPGPLTYSPSGSTGISPGTGGEFNFSFISTNSTYLPNGTLNEWDAPMPAGQVSFGITNGPGFFNQVNKTGLYSILVPSTTAPSSGVCPSNLVPNASPATVCLQAAYPDPFYAEAIPASPLIPPVTNNGGYLWDTFGFRGGTTLGATTGPGFVAGFSSTATFPVETPAGCGNPGSTTLCTSFGSCSQETTGPPPNNGGTSPAAGLLQGWTYVTAAAAGVFLGSTTAPAGCYVGTTPAVAPGTSGVPNIGVPQLDCAALHGHFIEATAPAGAVATGACWTAAPAATEPGGINLTNFGAGCPLSAGGTTIPSNSTTVEVANIAGYTVGDTVTVYSTGGGTQAAGSTIATGLRIASVSSGPDALNTTGVAPPVAASTADNTTGAPGTITFTAPYAGCVSIYQGIFAANSTAVPLLSSAAGLSSVTPGTEIDLILPSGRSVTAFVSDVGCAVPAASLPSGSTSICLEGGVPLLIATGGLPAGTLLVLGPAVGTVPLHDREPLFPASSDVSSVGQGPYPFWQWVPNPPPNQGSFPRSATVYSDNHGEAVVSLETGVAAQVAPSSTGACPANYFPIVINGVTVNCELDTRTLGTASTTPGGIAFQGIAGATGSFSASAPGCGIYNPANGTFGPAPTPTTTGTATPVATNLPAPSATSVVPGNGPGAGQICINNLGGIEFGAGAALGTTTVQAIGDYPYVRGLHPAISSGAVNKIWTSAWAKTLTVTPLPGGVGGPSGTTSYTVTITGTDICGNPILGEPVNVFALGNAGAVVLAPFGPGSSNGTNSATVFLSTGTGAFTGIPAGTATLSLEVLGTALGNGGLVVKAVFPLERVERFVTVIPGSTGPTTTQQLYPPGYSQVGGPAGTNFGSAEAVFAYNAASNSYTPVSSTNISSAPPTCQGYWAYFASAASVAITVTSHAGDTATCNLAAGWNLVGDPFGSTALLSAGVTAYHWNGTAYDTVTAIPLGGAVWIYETAAASVTLTAT
jgi:hypothetical protein